MIKQYIYHGFESFYDYYRDASEILESWNPEFKNLDGEFENDVVFTFEVVKIGGLDRFTKQQKEIDSLKAELTLLKAPTTLSVDLEKPVYDKQYNEIVINRVGKDTVDYSYKGGIERYLMAVDSCNENWFN